MVEAPLENELAEATNSAQDPRDWMEGIGMVWVRILFYVYQIVSLSNY